MLHTALVISAYMSMIFIPCACAQWGEVLTAEWRTMRRGLRLDMRRRREGMSEVLVRSLREAREAAYIAALAQIAFVEPKPLPRIIYRARKLSLGRARPRVRTADPVYFQRAVERIKMRLCELSEGFRLAHTVFSGASPAMAMGSVANIAPTMTNFAPRRYKQQVAPAIAKPTFAQPAIAAQAVQPQIAAQTNIDDRLTRRLFDQVGAFRRPVTGVVPKEIKPSRFASQPAAIEPSPLLHFPPSSAELEALFALDSQEAVSSDAVPIAVNQSSAKISAAA